LVSGQWEKIVVKFMIPRHTLDPSQNIYIQLHPPQSKKGSSPDTKTVQGSSPTAQTGHIHATQHLLLSFS